MARQRGGERDEGPQVAEGAGQFGDGERLAKRAEAGGDGVLWRVGDGVASSGPVMDVEVVESRRRGVVREAGCEKCPDAALGIPHGKEL